MATRRAVWPRPRLNGLSSFDAPRHEPPPGCVRFRRPALGRRSLASHAAASSASRQHRFSDFLPPRDRTELDILLGAIQRRETPRISDAFVAWTAVLSDPDSPYHEAAVRQAQDLPGPTLSEILRSLDPVLSPSRDVAHGLNLSQGHAQFTDAGRLVDKFGVRDIHRKIFAGMEVLMMVRGGSRLGLAPADYEVFMRCAGAAMDYQGVKAFWKSMAAHGLQDARTAKSWSEFIKARFITEPAYYQFDRSRVATLARDLFSNRSPLPMTTLVRLDRMRLSMNALKGQLWNRRPDQPEEDIRRLLRRRADYKGYKGHWIRALYYGHEMDEELLCTSMVAFARSSSLHSIKKMIFESYYGITIDEAPHPADTHISGGRDFAHDSPIRPSPRLLHAIVEAFGSMSHIPLGLKLLEFVSRRYDVAIPRETWSNFLSWTYVCASKPFRSMRKIHGGWQATAVRAADVRQVWDIMTSEPFNVTPTFEDLDIYIKTLIIQRCFFRAVDAIRDWAVPYYASLVEDYQTALFDEILQNDAASPASSSSPASHRRKRAELRKDHAHHLISSWFTRLLKVASENKSHRAGPFMHTLVPDLLLEFGDFFHPQLRYRTAQGRVQIDRPGATRRFDWARAWRATVPQKLPGAYVRHLEGSDDPDFPYPTAPSFKVLGWQRRPRSRPAAMGAAPRGGRGEKEEEEREWWGRLEAQLML